MGGEGVDDLAGLGVVKLFAGLSFYGVRIGLELFDVFAEAGILLLEAVDLFAELAVLEAFLLPDGEAVLAADDVPGKQESQRDCEDASGGAPDAHGRRNHPLGKGGGRRLAAGCGCFWLRFFVLHVPPECL